jgi:hypothetical protein
LVGINCDFAPEQQFVVTSFSDAVGCSGIDMCKIGRAHV